MEFETSRLIVRPMSMEDAADVYDYARDPSVAERAGWAAHTSPEKSRELLETWIADRCHNAIVWRESGRVIGCISVYPDSEEDRADTRELGYVLNKRYHGRGIMTEVVKETVKRLFQDGIEYVWACCFVGNEASRRVIEKCGFRFQQKGTFFSKSLDRAFDTLEYRRARGEEGATQTLVR